MAKKSSGGGWLAAFIIVFFVVALAALTSAEISRDAEDIRFGGTETAAGCLCVSMLILFGLVSAATSSRRKK